MKVNAGCLQNYVVANFNTLSIELSQPKVVHKKSDS